MANSRERVEISRNAEVLFPIAVGAVFLLVLVMGALLS